MTLRRAALFALLLAPLLANTATGADLPPRTAAPPVVDYAPPPPAFTWGGFYAGVQGGYGFSSFQDGGGALVGSPSGGLIGVTVGYNYMVAPQFLIGAEADFSFAGVDQTTSPYWGAVARGQVDNLLTIRGRAGYVMDRLMIFASGGFAGSSNSIAFAQGLFYGYQSSFQPGWALGAGAEYMITQNFSAKGEYLFTSTGSSQYFDFSPYALSSGVNMSTIRGGLNYHF